MGEITLVQYGPDYAAALADMWNKSGDNWGGNDKVYTEQEILDTEDLKGNLKTFLATDKDMVVGYCSFSEYKEDEGASYIPLLNVQPDYLGKKIGKQLVLACVDEAIKAQWPRLDLYTWPGNTKAVPLYKKCGFFWEKRDDSTHLMNFMPYVMKTEAVKDFFDILDWYEDSKRTIDIEPDGRTDGEFDYFDYTWEKNDLFLRTEFERRGRGLTAIETNDYLIEVRAHQQKLVMGMDYEIIYHIINKTGKTLDLNIEGQNHKNIHFNFNHNASFEGETTIKTRFKVLPIKESQDQWKSHPCVTSVMTINGQKATFMVGINPKLPLELTHGNHHTNLEIGHNTLYLDIENGFDERIYVEGHLPGNARIQPDSHQFSCTIEPLGKTSVPILYTLLDYGHYQENLTFNIQVGGQNIAYEATLNAMFRGYTARFHSMDKDFVYLVNGPYTLSYRRKNNSASLYHKKKQADNFLWIATPQLGLPYTVEFSNVKPADIAYTETRDSSILAVTFNSQNLPGTQVTFYYQLMSNGLLNLYAKIMNTSTRDLKRLGVNYKIFHLLDDAQIPYDGKIVSSMLRNAYYAGGWDKSHVDENWLMSGHDLKKTVHWDDSHIMKFNQQFVEFEAETELIPSKGSYEIRPIVLGLNAFTDYQSLRKHIGYTDNRLEIHDLDIACNDHNPFLEDDALNLTVTECKSKKVSASLNVTSNGGAWAAEDVVLEFNEGVSNLSLKGDSPSEMDVLKLDIETDISSYSVEKMLFIKGTDPVKTAISTIDEQSVYIANNGLIEIKSSPTFCTGIFAMSYKGHDWLDNAFPVQTEKAWWNYWTGGMHTIPENFNNMSVFEESKTSEFVTVKDNKGNHWSGIKTSLNIRQQETHKGTVIDEYFLMLPQVPVMCHFSVIHQNTNTYVTAHYVTIEFIQGGQDIQDNWLMIQSESKPVKYKCNADGFETDYKHCISFGSNTTHMMMTKLGDANKSHDVNNTNGVLLTDTVDIIEQPHGSSTVFDTAFYVFTDVLPTKEMLEDLYGIHFKL